VSDAPPRGVVALLTAQAFAFGVTLALLIVPANALFLDAYGSEWLPATYIAIAIVGTAASALIARAARRTRLAHVAVASLGALAALYAASWVILVGNGVWVSAVLLVLFPIALQIGFVFIGGQAGRLLDVRQMKERFPRIVSGFAVGFLVGGLLGIPLLALLGSTEHLLVATTAAQLVFLALLLETERRFPEVRAAAAEDTREVTRPPLRTLFASGIVLALLIYQVLSAMGSWVVDFLLFDRAAAQYSGDDLTRFLSGYTALTNLVDILFLAVLAGPLLRRFGLRLGLLLNPTAVAGILAVMLVVGAGAGVAAYSVFVLAAVLRIADIATTDGTTRTSVNAAFQVVPVEERLAVQAVVEGIGVPLAIGATGVLLLLLRLLELGTGAVIAFGLVLAVVWTVVAHVVYRSYRQSLADDMRRRSFGTELDVTADDVVAMRGLLRSNDARDVRLGLDLLAGLAVPPLDVDLRHVAAHADPEVRARSLVQLAEHGDERAAAEAAGLLDGLAASTDPAGRRAAAAVLASPAVGADRGSLARLLADRDPTVRAAALDAVRPEDVRSPAVLEAVVAAAQERRLTGPATAAVGRLGDAAGPLLAGALAAADGPSPPALLRAAAAHDAELVAPALADGDRTVVLAALEALAAAGSAVPAAVHADVLRDAATLAAHAGAAHGALPAESPLARALEDEVDLARRLAVASLTLAHGERVRAAVRVVDHAEGQRRALGVEALDVVLSRQEAAAALPLLQPRLTPAERSAAISARAPAPRSADEWIADILDDPDDVWRSPWLATCARHAAGRDPA
jgi:hypothetical protein